MIGNAKLDRCVGKIHNYPPVRIKHGVILPVNLGCRNYFGYGLMLLSVSLLLTGCGFKLAGSASLPQSLGLIHLVTRDFSDRQTELLRQRLVAAGAVVSLQPVDAAVMLRVTLRVLPDRRLIESASTGKKVERLSRQLTFRLSGPVSSTAKTLTQQKEIQLDDDNLLASAAERRVVIEEIEMALFRQLLYQLQRI